MNTKDILIAARAKIERPENWTKGTSCTIKAGHLCFCASGAIREAAWGAAWLEGKSLELLAAAVGWYIIPWNDAPERTHAEVLAAFDAAITRAEEP